MGGGVNVPKDWLQEWEAQQLAAQQAEIDARLGGAKFEPLSPALQAMLDVQTLQDAQFNTARTAPIAPPNVYNISDPATRLTESELEREWIGNKVFNQPRVSSPFTMGPSGMQSRGRTQPAPTSTTPTGPTRVPPAVAARQSKPTVKPPASMDIYSRRARTDTAPTTTATTDPELTAIQDAATAAGDPFAAADAAGTDIRGRDLSYLQDKN